MIMVFWLIQVLHHDSTAIVRGTGDGREVAPFIPPDCIVKWSRRSTAIKIKVCWQIPVHDTCKVGVVCLSVCGLAS